MIIDRDAVARRVRRHICVPLRPIVSEASRTVTLQTAGSHAI